MKFDSTIVLTGLISYILFIEYIKLPSIIYSKNELEIFTNFLFFCIVFVSFIVFLCLVIKKSEEEKLYAKLSRKQ